ncbi:MAG: YjbH domain-containing protein, partial [bacterium]
APPASATDPGEEGWLSLHGMSGLVLTPTAEVTQDATVRLGYSFMDQKWVPHGRGEFDNEIYFLDFGFLPRVEATVRATVLPGSRLTRFDEAPIVDRMGSVRLQLLRPSRVPALAVGIDDVRGTRFYHSLYVVGTQRVAFDVARLDLRLSAGYGSRALEANNYLLDGVFGGLEARVFRTVSFVGDYDTEKWNAGVRLLLFRRISAHLAWLDLEIPAGGVGFLHRF